MYRIDARYDVTNSPYVKLEVVTYEFGPHKLHLI